MTDRAGTEHVWAASRLHAYWAGLLVPREEARLKDHMAKCERCKEAMAAFSEEDAGSAACGHIPADLLARWGRTKGSLRGLERTLVRRHLDRCAECRQDLELLGHSPLLEIDAALEGESDLSPLPGEAEGGSHISLAGRWLGWLKPASGFHFRPAYALAALVLLLVIPVYVFLSGPRVPVLVIRDDTTWRGAKRAEWQFDLPTTRGEIRLEIYDPQDLDAVRYEIMACFVSARGDTVPLLSSKDYSRVVGVKGQKFFSIPLDWKRSEGGTINVLVTERYRNAAIATPKSARSYLVRVPSS